MAKKLKKRVFFLIYCGAFLLPLAFFIPAGAVNSGWVKLLGTAAHDLGRDITVDVADNIYVTGYTAGFLDGEVNAGGYDIFLTKYDTNGNRLWTQLLGTAFRDDGYGAATDSTGNIYITGRTNGDLDGEVNTGGYDIFLAKYDTNGNRLWTRLLGTAVAECGYGIVVDSTDNVYVTGSTEGDLDGLPNAGGSDSFLTKYDTNGNRLWTQLLGTAFDDQGRRVAADSTGNIYVTGSTEGDLDGLPNAGGSDSFLVKYDTNGNRLWTQLLGTAFRDDGCDVIVDAGGNVFVTGFTEGELDGEVNTGGYDIFLAKYDANGNRLWTRLLGTAFRDDGYGVATDSTGNIYVTGRTNGHLDGRTNTGGYDIFLATYETNGSRLSTDLLGTAFADYGYGIVADSADNVYVTGFTDGHLDGLPNAGGSDSFIWKQLPASDENNDRDRRSHGGADWCFISTAASGFRMTK